LRKAKELFLVAIKLDPKNGFYQNNLGSILLNMGKYQEAVLYLENAVGIDPGVAKRWMNLAICFEKMKKYSRAKEAIRKAIKLEPGNSKYSKILEHIKNLENES